MLCWVLCGRVPVLQIAVCGTQHIVGKLLQYTKYHHFRTYRMMDEKIDESFRKGSGAAFPNGSLKNQNSVMIVTDDINEPQKQSPITYQSPPSSDARSMPDARASTLLKNKLQQPLLTSFSFREKKSSQL